MLFYRFYQNHLSQSDLTDEQKAAAAFVLGSHDRSVIVSGVAGSGKSHLVRAVKDGARGRNFLALAPTASAAVDLGKSAGIKANTLTGFLQTGGHTINRNTVLFIDESSMANTRQALRIMEIADQKKARLVFLGDTKQFDAIEQGKPFGMLMQMGMRTSFIQRSFRQKNQDMQSLVQAARKGLSSEVFRRLANRIEQHEPKELAKEVAEQWIRHPHRDKVQIAALDNSSRISTNALIRQELQEKGLINQQNYHFQILSSKGLTPAQLSLADYYKEGDVLVFHMGHKALNIAKGDKFRVVSKKDGHVVVESTKSGDAFSFDPSKTRKKGLTLYSEQDRKLSKGDKIQWRHNLDKDDKVKNGHTGEIKSFDGRKATIKFDHGITRKLDLDKNQFWGHGYVITTYKQQGKTTPVNWIVANTTKVGEITQKALYVSLTRAERSVKLFTDDADKLKAQVIQNPGGKTSSLQGRGISYDLRSSTAGREQSKLDKFIDGLPWQVRTPAANLLDRLAEAKGRHADRDTADALHQYEHNRAEGSEAPTNLKELVQQQHEKTLNSGKTHETVHEHQSDQLER